MGFGASSAACLLAHVPILSLIFFIKPVAMTLQSHHPERHITGWGLGYTLVSASWLFPALSLTEAAAGSILAALLAAAVYGLPAILLRWHRTQILWPIATALAEFCAAEAGYSLAPIGLWGVESGFGYVVQLGSIYYATVAICLSVLLVAKFYRSHTNLLLLAPLGIIFLIAPMPVQTKLTIVGIATQPDATAKWTPDGAVASLAALKEASRSHANSDLIVWPENAVSTTFQLDQALVALEPMEIPLLFGMTRYQSIGQPTLLNSAVLLENGTVQASDKVRLVPLHETGVAGLFPDQITVGERHILTLGSGVRLLPLICYEIAFTISDRYIQNADLIIVISAETGFQTQIVSNLMTLHATARSLESGLPVIRITDTGKR